MAKKKIAPKSFGEKLKTLREREGISIKELSEQVKMKKAYLERIENDEALAPVAEILRIARTLSVDPSDFMGEIKTKASPGKRKKASDIRTKDYAYENLTSESHERHIMAFRVTIDPASDHPKVGYTHQGEEFIYVLSGKLKITVGRKTSTIKTGETIHFDSQKRHKLSNPGKKPTALLVVIYTP
jgi:electron transfer flavoprotein alpha subunit